MSLCMHVHSSAVKSSRHYFINCTHMIKIILEHVNIILI